MTAYSMLKSQNFLVKLLSHGNVHSKKDSFLHVGQEEKSKKAQPNTWNIFPLNIYIYLKPIKFHFTMLAPFV